MSDLSLLEAADSALRTGDVAAAAQHLSALVLVAPSLGVAWAGLGSARRRLGDLAGAIDAYRKAISLGHADASTLNGLGIALKEDGQLALAEAAYRRALESAPLAAVYVNLANAIGDQGRREEAVLAYEAALALDPGLAEAHFNLFAAVYDTDPVRGEACLERALEARPDYTAARFHLGALRALRGRDDEAASLLSGAPEHLASSLEFIRGRGVRVYTDGFTLLEAALAKCDVEGSVLELGVRRGTSIRFIAERVAGSRVDGFDSFEGLPTAWGELAAGAYTTGGEMPSVPSNVVLHVGWFKDTLAPFVRENPQPIRFLNVDCDLYASTREAFDALGGLLARGSVIVFDEYLANPGWEGEEHRALVEASAEHGFSFDYIAFSLFSRQAAIVVREKQLG